MFIIALTGGIASGKTTVSELFKEKSVPIIDTDIIAREIVELNKPAYIEVIKTFGREILNQDKTINRQALAKLIFSSSDKRLQLEGILHPVIWQEVKSQLNSLSSLYCIVVVPLLIENLSKEKDVSFDRILVIDVDENIQLERCQKRDSAHTDEIKKIIQTQVSRQTRNNAADDVIQNIGSLSSLSKEVEVLHKQYLQLAK